MRAAITQRRFRLQRKSGRPLSYLHGSSKGFLVVVRIGRNLEVKIISHGVHSLLQKLPGPNVRYALINRQGIGPRPVYETVHVMKATVVAQTLVKRTIP